MTKMKNDKEIKRVDIDFTHAENKVKWLDNQGVTLIGTCLESCNKASTTSWHKKGKMTKLAIACLQRIKKFNSGVGGVNIMGRKTAAYRVNIKLSSRRYYLR